MSFPTCRTLTLDDREVEFGFAEVLHTQNVEDADDANEDNVVAPCMGWVLIPERQEDLSGCDFNGAEKAISTGSQRE